MMSHKLLLGIALATAFAVAAQGILSVASPKGDKNGPEPAGTYFRLVPTPTNCTEPCVIHFEVETDDISLLFFRWNFTNDSFWDTPWMTNTFIDKLFYEYYHGGVCVEGWDGLYNYRLSCGWIDIYTSPPQATLSVLNPSVNATATLRIAGEKWHDVAVYLVDALNETLVGTLVREPGKPQTLSFNVSVGPSESGSLRLAYTPFDDVGNGSTPAWLDIVTETGESLGMHHIFNAQHPDTWNWTVPLNWTLAGNHLVFVGNATDAAPDDLTFEWDFGDGSPVESYTYSSLGVHPFTATDMRPHTYAAAGAYTVTLTVTDDDGAGMVVRMTVQIG